MKKLIYILLLGFITNANALDLDTDAACAPLKIALETAQPIAKVQEAWQQTLAQGPHSKFETIGLATQAISYCQAQKEILEQQKTVLEHSTRGTSLKKGAFKTAVGTWCGAGLLTCGLVATKFIEDKYIENRWGKIILPDIAFAHHIPKSVKNHIWFTRKAYRVYYFFPALLFARLCLAPWLLYTGISEFSQGITRKRVDAKITNLDAAIEFIHPWTDPIF